MSETFDPGSSHAGRTSGRPPTEPGFLANPSGGAALSDEEKTMAMLCHLLSLFTSFIGPLVIWLIRKDRSRFVDAHGRAVLNFIISITIYSIGLAVLLVCAGFLGAATRGIGFVLMCPIYLALIGLSIFCLVITIMRCVEAAQGGFTPYPISLNLIPPVDPFESGPVVG